MAAAAPVGMRSNDSGEGSTDLHMSEISLFGTLAFAHNRVAREGNLDMLVALIKACSHGHEPCVEVLLSSGALCSAHKTNGFTPLHYAAAGGHVSIVRLLISRGAVVDGRDHKGERAIDVAARAGSAKVVEALLENGANVSIRTNNGRSCLHTAAAHGHVEVLQLLLKGGANPSMTDNGGGQPIHEAAGGGHVECLELLLQGGADPTVCDASGCTPLHHVASSGHVAAARWLVKRKVDVEAKDAKCSTALYWASSRGQTEMVLYLIQEANANPSAANLFRSPLHVAAGWGHVGICEILLKAGADITARDKGWSNSDSSCPDYHAISGSGKNVLWHLKDLSQQKWDFNPAINNKWRKSCIMYEILA